MFLIIFEHHRRLGGIFQRAAYRVRVVFYRPMSHVLLFLAVEDIMMSSVFAELIIMHFSFNDYIILQIMSVLVC
jgi:hypothetical protein